MRNLIIKRSTLFLVAITIALSYLLAPTGVQSSYDVKEADKSTFDSENPKFASQVYNVGYPDVANDRYFSDAIETLRQENVFEGTECGGNFCPDEFVDRSTLAVWLVRVLDGVDPAPVGSSEFSDVADNHPWGDHIARLAELNVTRGCSQGTFCPDGIVTREQMASFLVRAFQLEEASPPGFVDVLEGSTHFAAINSLAEANITTGCSAEPLRFCPRQNVTRAQFATFLYRAINVGSSISEGSSISDSFLETEEELLPRVEIEQVTAGGAHSCIIDSRFQLACWGNNEHGQVTAPEAQYKQVSAGEWHTCAIRQDDTVVCWGRNDNGQTDQTSQLATAISSGFGHSCVLLFDGLITCWGDNTYGQTEVPSGTYQALSTGSFHSCGLRLDNTIACWGSDFAGITEVPAGNYKKVSLGYEHACAIALDDTVTCWGNNDAGQTDAPSGRYKVVASGAWHTCAIALDDTLACWGANDFEDGNESDDNQYLVDYGQASTPFGEFTDLSSGRLHSCGVTKLKALVCWGSNSDGQASTELIQ